MSGEEEDAETVVDVLAQARDAEEPLLDHSWKLVDVEPGIIHR